MTSNETYIEESLKVIKILFVISGIEVIKEKYSFKDKFVFIFNRLWWGVDGAGSVYLLIKQIQKGNEFVHILYTTPIMVLCCVSLFKSSAIVWNRKTAHNIYTSLKDLELEINQNNAKAFERGKILREKKLLLHKVFRAINFVFIALSFAFAVHPIYTTIVIYIKYKKIVLGLPFQVKYPFDPFDWKYYPAVYIHQLWSEIVIIWDLVVVDHLFFTLCLYTCAQLQLLQYDFENLINDSGLNKEQFKNKFRELVKRHIKLIRAAEMLETLTTTSTLWNFILSSLLICLTGFGLLMIKDFNLIFIFFSFLSACLLQVFLICYFGDLLMTSSSQVGYAVYRSNWYSKDLAVKKDLLMVLIRAQKACKLTAYTFTDVNLNAFMRIIGNSWSYFALLKTMYG